MFQEAIKSLTSFQASIDRLAKAIEDLKQVSNSEPAPEKKSSPKPKKDTSKESAAPASSPATEPAAKPVDGSSTASPAASKAPEVPTTPSAPKDEEDDFGTAAPKTYTDVDVRNAAIKCAAVLKTDDKAKEIIKTIGNSPNIKSMDPSKYAAVMAAFEEAMKGK